MRKIFALVFLLIFNCTNNYAQNISNQGKNFWLGFPISSTTTQDMTLYLSCENLPTGLNYATVTVTIDSSGTSSNTWWSRTYHIPANTAIDISKTTAYSFSPASALAIGSLPKGLNFDCTLSSPACPFGNGGTGIFTNKGIHITSNVDITAFAHLYGSVSAGATMLLPTSSWGYSYTTVNSAQNSAQGESNFFFVIANEDSTRVKITASNFSNATTNCQPAVPTPLTSYIVELQKGHIYQYLGRTDATTYNGVELTGSKIQSIPNANGVTKKITVFAGSTRTGGESGTSCSVSSRDNDMQQCYPENTWGKKYALVPFAASSSSINTSTFSGTVYKIIAKDTGTFVAIGGAMPIAISTIGAYKLSASTPKYVEANKPIMIAQFMTSGNCNSGDGDPEMIYLNSLEQVISSTTFYRANAEVSNRNFVNIVVPDSGIATLKIDGLGQSANWGGNVTVKSHQEIIGYKIVVKGWAAASQQCVINSNARFNAFTYGTGGVESYGFSCGTNLNDLTPKFSISGLLISSLNKQINKGNIVINGTTNTNSISDSTGWFNINVSEGNYTLRPTKNNDITKANGVTSVDVLLVQRHILNTTKIKGAYKLIAADVDGNKAINSVDVLRIKRLILGTDTTFTKTVGTVKIDRLWEFVDSAYVFPDTTNPFPFKDSISFANLTSNKTNQTFIGVKLGDVNDSWNPAIARGVATKAVEFVYNISNLYRAKNPIKIVVTANNFKDIAALQYTLHFDNDKYEFAGIENNKLNFDFNSNKANTTGNIAMLWTDKNAASQTLENGSELFTLILKPKANFRSTNESELLLTNDIANIEAWDNDYKKHHIVLIKRQTINNKPQTTSELVIYPNPATSIVNIECSNAKRIVIIDAMSRIVQQINYVTQPLTINCKLLTKGVYIVQATMQDGSIKNEKLVVE